MARSLATNRTLATNRQPATNRALATNRVLADYAYRVLQVAPANIIASYPFWEESGSTATDLKNGYAAAITGADVGQPGAGDGHTAFSFDGTNDAVLAYDVGLVPNGLGALFNGAAGTIGGLVQVPNAGSWTDGLLRTFVHAIADNNNEIRIGKSTTNNRIEFRYRAGAVTKSVNAIVSAPVNWMHCMITWDKAADQMIAYWNWTQTGAIQTALGTWAGLPQFIVFGSNSSPSTGVTFVHLGSLAHWTFWNRALTASEVLQLRIGV